MRAALTLFSADIRDRLNIDQAMKRYEFHDSLTDADVECLLKVSREPARWSKWTPHHHNRTYTQFGYGGGGYRSGSGDGQDCRYSEAPKPPNNEKANESAESEIPDENLQSTAEIPRETVLEEHGLHLFRCWPFLRESEKGQGNALLLQRLDAMEKKLAGPIDGAAYPEAALGHWAHIAILRHVARQDFESAKNLAFDLIGAYHSELLYRMTLPYKPIYFDEGMLDSFMWFLGMCEGFPVADLIAIQAKLQSALVTPAEFADIRSIRAVGLLDRLQRESGLGMEYYAYEPQGHLFSDLLKPVVWPILSRRFEKTALAYAQCDEKAMAREAALVKFWYGAMNVRITHSTDLHLDSSSRFDPDTDLAFYNERLDFARRLLAVTIFRRETGAWPRSISDLSPGHVDESFRPSENEAWFIVRLAESDKDTPPAVCHVLSLTAKGSELLREMLSQQPEIQTFEELVKRCQRTPRLPKPTLQVVGVIPSETAMAYEYIKCLSSDSPISDILDLEEKSSRGVPEPRGYTLPFEGISGMGYGSATASMGYGAGGR